MWQVLEEEIERKARNILAKQNREHAAAKKHASRFSLRTGTPSITAAYRRPSYWDYDNQFDPVYCIAHARFLAKRIWDKIQTGSYEPSPQYFFKSRNRTAASETS